MAIFDNFHCSPRKPKRLKRKLLKWRQRPPTRVWHVVPFLTITLLYACGGNPFEADLADYTVRLERVLEQPPAPPQAASLPAFPAKKRLFLEVQGSHIDLLDFLRLGHCQLQAVVAEKNSSLGKLAVESVVLQQEVSFLAVIDQCLAQLDNAELRATLLAAREQKRADLDKILWNALFAGREMRQFWSRQSSDHPHTVESRLQYALSTLQQQTEAVRQRRFEDFKPAEFEAALQVLRSGEGAALLHSWHLVAKHLPRATSVAERRVQGKPLCFEDMRNPKAEYFRNVVLNEFVAGLQKDIAILNQRYFDVLVPLQALEAEFTQVETEAYRQFRHHRDERFKAGLEAVQRHVAAIQPLMVQCGFIPEP